MEKIMADPRLGRNLVAPSISAGRDNLYMRGAALCEFSSMASPCRLLTRKHHSADTPRSARKPVPPTLQLARQLMQPQQQWLTAAVQQWLVHTDVQCQTKPPYVDTHTAASFVPQLLLPCCVH